MFERVTSLTIMRLLHLPCLCPFGVSMLLRNVVDVLLFVFFCPNPKKWRDYVKDHKVNSTNVLPIVGSLFLEFWKREQAGIQFRWNLINFEDEEEPPRPEYLMRLAGSRFKKIHKVSGVRITCTQIIICKTSGN